VAPLQKIFIFRSSSEVNYCSASGGEGTFAFSVRMRVIIKMVRVVAEVGAPWYSHLAPGEHSARWEIPTAKYRHFSP
jgi:hypothetical protein